MPSPGLFPSTQGPLATQIPAWIIKDHRWRKAKESGEMGGRDERRDKREEREKWGAGGAEGETLDPQATGLQTSDSCSGSRWPCAECSEMKGSRDHHQALMPGVLTCSRLSAAQGVSGPEARWRERRVREKLRAPGPALAS